MIGNDIIDLDTAEKESHWRRKGYVQKIFTEAEQQLILDSAAASTMVWILWSMKEAAYKIYNRQTGTRSYIPLKLICSDLEIMSTGVFGKVSCEGSLYYTKTEITNRYIHTSAVADSRIFKDLVLILHEGEDAEKRPDAILKDPFGLPFLVDKNNSEMLPMSISHHGQFHSYLFTQ